MDSVVAVQVNDILSVIHACILLTIIVGFCRIVDASNYSTFHLRLDGMVKGGL